LRLYHIGNTPEKKAKPAAPVIPKAAHDVIGVNALTPDQVLTIVERLYPNDKKTENYGLD